MFYYNFLLKESSLINRESTKLTLIFIFECMNYLYCFGWKQHKFFFLFKFRLDLKINAKRQLVNFGVHSEKSYKRSLYNFRYWYTCISMQTYHLFLCFYNFLLGFVVFLSVFFELFRNFFSLEYWIIQSRCL